VLIFSLIFSLFYFIFITFLHSKTQNNPA